MAIGILGPVELRGGVEGWACRKGWMCDLLIDESINIPYWT